MSVKRAGLFYLLGVFGIICISIFPHVFETRGVQDPIGYVIDLVSFLISLFQPESWLFVSENTVGQESIIKVLWNPYIYSMQILLGALLAGFFIAFILSFIANYMPNAILKGLKRILDMIETVPDLIVALLLQMLVIYVYKVSGVDLFRVGSYMDERAYLGPIITLAILPMIALFKILLLMFEEEYLKDYVGFLKSKGLKKSGILLRHILRNILPTTFRHCKIIIWATLSSQFIIERIFNVHGLTYYIVESFTPMTIAVSLIFLFTPFFFFFQLIDWWLNEDREAILEEEAKEEKERERFWYLKPVKFVLFLFFEQMRNYKFAIGSLFFIIVICISVIYSVTTDNHVDQLKFLYAEDGTTLIGTPPFPPTEPFLLGSDRFGFSIMDQLIIGAKYTLIIGLIIALLRVFGGLTGGLLFAFKMKTKEQKSLEKMVDSIHFLPLSVIAYLLLAPILLESSGGFTYSFTQRILLEIIILTILVVPLTSVLLGNEIKNIMRSDFISSAKVLGGGTFHIFWKHVFPHIGPRMAMLFGQQFIQVLLIFIHLGVFDFFLGGTNVSFGLVESPPSSITYEWSGLIGSTTVALSTGRYWMILWVLLAFMLSIFAMQLIILGVKEVQQAKVGVIFNYRKYKRNKKSKREKETTTFRPSKESFTWVEKKDSRKIQS
ncbi:ABC transporter permease subunit [Virgibacillus flavescens]|uniref:ABC transporter permease subunit n=1 Tax=Virgibacillus flavescens TaxID=1611422 RepID=UPI003D34B85F